jgi:hypothetical protein
LVARLVDEAREEFPELGIEEIDVTEHPEIAVGSAAVTVELTRLSGPRFRVRPRS